MMIKKKAQEEIVGFVAIVVIVAIVSVVFLGISIRKTNNVSQESKDIAQFLDSIMQYTSNCAISYEPDYLKLSELIQECSKSARNCISGKNSCDEAEQILSGVIKASFHVGDEESIKGYEFKSSKEALGNNAGEEIIFSLNKGNCSQSVRGGEVLTYSGGGVISNSLKLCY